MMDELKQILMEHARRYPRMEPQDAVKLIYQNEFGGGHLIVDEAACLNYLRREYDSIIKAPGGMLLEQIGNDLVRVHLAAVPADRLDALGAAFLSSAKDHKGNLSSFLRKLEVLSQLCHAGVFSFDSVQLAAYLEAYAKQGYPMVSHSESYRSAYQPAYRVVREQNFMG